MSKQRILAALAGLALLGAAAVPAAVVTLEDTTQTTTLTAEVSEQAAVTVPVGVSFNVVDIASSTAAAGASVDVDNIVLASATKQLKVSLQANAASFSPPVALATTWSAGDVSWNAATWASATGASGALSDSSFNEVATCAADSDACSTSGLIFTLGAKDTVKRSGDHTLVVTWKFESI